MFAEFKIHGPLDDWSTREKLALACSVLRNGDQNSVTILTLFGHAGIIHVYN
jgi:hypothetical protein